jgi:large subunit ribosomal protein L1
MAKRSKRYQQVRATVDRVRRYPLEEALRLIREQASPQFDETVEVAIKLGVDPRQNEQRVRGTVVLPHGTGKVPRVVVFAQGEKAVEAQEAGADEVGADDLIQKIDGGWSDFDILAATPDLMPKVGRLGRKLGPRMPNARAGTVTMDIGPAVRELKAGKVEYRSDNRTGGVVQCAIGKKSFTLEQLRENFGVLLNAVVRAKPSASKGTYLRRIFLSSTMGPGLAIDVADAQAVAAEI